MKRARVQQTETNSLTCSVFGPDRITSRPDYFFWHPCKIRDEAAKMEIAETNEAVSKTNAPVATPMLTLLQ